MKSNKLFPDEPSNYCIVTCGDWDIDMCLRENLKYWKISMPECCKRWINIKKALSVLAKQKIGSMLDMLAYCDLELKGRHHSGIDDSMNIAACAIYMLDKLNWNPEVTKYFGK
jgi:inhibitor of KinA sporulation pathway (predicted exonuclease)